MLLGIDLSTHHTSVVLANQYGQSELALRSELPRGGGSPEVWGAVVATAREVLRRATIEPSGIASTIISFPAPLMNAGRVER